jgi:hypothetical protein
MRMTAQRWLEHCLCLPGSETSLVLSILPVAFSASKATPPLVEVHFETRHSSKLYPGY